MQESTSKREACYLGNFGDKELTEHSNISWRPIYILKRNPSHCQVRSTENCLVGNQNFSGLLETFLKKIQASMRLELPMI